MIGSLVLIRSTVRRIDIKPVDRLVSSCLLGSLFIGTIPTYDQNHKGRRQERWHMEIL